jgi:ribonuclease-3
MSQPRAVLLDRLQDRMGYRFHDVALLDRALTHRSWAHDQQRHDAAGVLEDNERLEFLGDCVFYAVVADHLYRAHPSATEGDLTDLRRHLICGPRQTAFGRSLGLDRPGLVRLGHLPADQVERGLDKIVEDAVEALVGAVFLDGGLAAAHALLDPWIVAEEPSSRDARPAKSILQEVLQAAHLPIPTYLTDRESGPDHRPWFACAAMVSTAPEAPAQAWGHGEGASKKEAERLAAIDALARLRAEGVLGVEGGQDGGGAGIAAVGGQQIDGGA